MLGNMNRNRGRGIEIEIEIVRTSLSLSLSLSLVRLSFLTSSLRVAFVHSFLSARDMKPGSMRSYPCQGRGDGGIRGSSESNSGAPQSVMNE